MNEATGAVFAYTYLDLVREVGALSLADCDPECSHAQHRREAAGFVNILLENPRLIRRLAVISEGFDS